MAKWDEDLDNALKAHVAELEEDAKEGFNEEEWRQGYISETGAKPEALEVEEFKSHLDIE